MAPMVVDPARVRAFTDAVAFHDWLARNLAAIHDGWRAGRGSGPADS